MEYEKFLENNGEAMISALQRVLRCKSEAAESVTAEDGSVYPFGRGVQEALETALSIGEELGFETVNVDNYGGHIDFPGKGDKIMAILGHLDVVPAGSGWKCDPYGGEIIDGKLYGRGVMDDKGPVISCLFAMKALKDSGFVPEATVRLILGLDEETHWKGMDYYFSQMPRPDYGFTPDAYFPAINAEKGLLIFRLAKKFNAFRGSGLKLSSLRGGTAANSVPDSCRAVLNSPRPEQYEEIKQKVEDYRSRSGYKLSVRGVGKSLELTAAGKAAHGARPEDGLNAVSVMMEFLGGLNFANEDINDFVSFYNTHIGFCLNGSSIGAGLKDEVSGELTFNLGMIEADAESAQLTVNVRYPVTASQEQFFSAMEPVLEKYDIGLIKGEHRAPIYFDRESPMVKTLMEIYRRHTGDEKSQPQVMGGATYARATPGILAYGPLFPWLEDLMHQKDECLELSAIKLMTEIYAEAIYRLSSE